MVRHSKSPDYCKILGNFNGNIIAKIEGHEDCWSVIGGFFGRLLQRSAL
ncbi:protein of unknown function [Xenorhabdus poinarii G6]|uniref:Uncharacterized protein n=1 Tax=Xenorhabdus poinarii G6 TaxID=1354304 RepID=A0A068R1E9_9GAMM|nr:protein of unknown function [Xenorhabdus poinarii G6]